MDQQFLPLWQEMSAGFFKHWESLFKLSTPDFNRMPQAPAQQSNRDFRSNLLTQPIKQTLDHCHFVLNCAERSFELFANNLLTANHLLQQSSTHAENNNKPTTDLMQPDKLASQIVKTAKITKKTLASTLANKKQQPKQPKKLTTKALAKAAAKAPADSHTKKLKHKKTGSARLNAN